MTNIWTWSRTASSNATADGSLWPENQLPSTVNNSARDNMASVARHRDDVSGMLVTAGTSNAYTLTSATTGLALVDGLTVAFRADRANTGAATLTVDSAAAKNLKKLGGTALASGDIVEGAIYRATYYQVADEWRIQSVPGAAQLGSANTFTDTQTISKNTAALPTPPAGAMVHLGNADGETTRVIADAFGAGTAQYSVRRAAGTAETQTALVSDNLIGGVTWYGRGPSTYSSSYRASILGYAAEDWTDTGQGTYLTFSTTANTTGTVAERMRIDSAGNVGIGTASPDTKVHAFGAGSDPSLSSDTSIVKVEASPGQELAFGGQNASPYAMWVQTKFSGNNSTAYPLALNPLGGNVGIGTASPAYPLDVNGVIARSGVPLREVLGTTRTYYVRKDGNDANTGLVNNAGGAFLTIQKAIQTVAALDLNSQSCTIQVGDGTYAEALGLLSCTGFVSAGQVVLRGNSATPANVVISSGGSAVTADGVRSVWDIRDMKLEATTAGYGIFANAGSSVRFGNIVFGACATAHIHANNGASVQATSGYSIVGAATAHLYGLNGGSVNVASVTVTITGTLNFSNAFAYGTILAQLVANAITFSGGTVTGKRYSGANNTVIFTAGGGANYFPGDAAGTLATGAEYA